MAVGMAEIDLPSMSIKENVRCSEGTTHLTMFEEKLLVGIASLASTVAVIVCLVVIPSLYSTINEVHEEV